MAQFWIVVDAASSVKTFNGLENAPLAFIGVLNGKNSDTLIVRPADD